MPDARMRRIVAHPRFRDAAALAGLALLWLFFYWRFLPTGLVPAADRLEFPGGDFWHHYFLYRSFAFEELRAGRLPLWMSCVFSGYPFQADPQSALLYPSTVLSVGFWLAVGAEHFPRAAFQLESLVHVLLGAWLMYAFLRGEVRRRSAALLGALVFGFGGYLTGYPPLQIAILQGSVWLPLALIGVRGVVTRGRARDVLLLVAAWTFSVLAGNPQTYTYVIYASLAYAVWRAATSAGGVGGARATALRVGLALGATLGLAAFQLVPGFEYAGLSTRAALSYEQAGTGFPLQDLVQLVVPGFVSEWQPLYAGLLPLALGAYALLAWRRVGRSPSRDVLFWLALGLTGLILSFGQNVFGFDLGYWLVPGYRVFRSQERHALWVALALAALAAHGADRLFGPLSRRERRTAWRVGLALGAGTLLLFVALAVVTYLQRLGYDPSDRGGLPGRVGLAFLIAGLAAALWAARLRGMPARVVALLAIALVAFDLLSTGRDQNAAAPAPLYGDVPLFEPILADTQARPFRLQDDALLPEHIACAYGLDEIWGAASIKPAAYARFIGRAPEAVRWKVLAVRYLVSWRGDLRTREEQLVPGERVVEEGEGTGFKATYRLAELPRWAWLVHQAQDVSSDEALYAALAAPDFDPFTTALLREPHGALGTLPTLAERVALRERWPGHLALDVEAGSPGLLVVSEAAYPGWVATVDGTARPVLTVDGVVMGVEVPTGAQRVLLDYRPPALVAGAAVSLATLAAILVVMALASRRSGASGQ